MMTLQPPPAFMRWYSRLFPTARLVTVAGAKLSAAAKSSISLIRSDLVMMRTSGTFVPAMSRDYCRLSAKMSGRYDWPIMPRTFRQALLATVSETGTSIAEVARGAGVSYEQLKKVGQREAASTNVDDAVRVANYFGFTIDEFLQDNLASDRIAGARLWFRLTEAERNILLAAARGGAALDRGEG